MAERSPRPSSSTCSPSSPPRRRPCLIPTSILLLPLVLLLLSTLPSSTLALGPALAEQDQIYFGVWVDSDVGFSDSPSLYNQRLQRNASVFHVAQKMPLDPYNYTTGVGGPAPQYLIENTGTDAAIFMTVYPLSLDTLTDDDHEVLGTQLLAYSNDFNRTVFLRWAPEMQGRWNAYGQRPSLFTAAWQRMYQYIKKKAPQTIIVWAPNLGHDYPYGQTENIAPEDMALLDTNKNGRLDYADDPYMPYYPGDDFVDWIGLSVYFKQFSRNLNLAQPAGFCGDIMTGIDSQTRRASGFDWYNTFCASKPTKACLIAESGAAYHPVDTPGDDSQLTIQQAWWRDCITNTTFMDTFPRIKLHMHFEFQKIEVDIGPPNIRDYRLTNNSDVLTAFQADLTSVQDRFVWAQFRRQTRPIQVGGPGVSGDGDVTTPVPVLVMQTARNPMNTGLPSLFGKTKANASDATRNRSEVSLAFIITGLSTIFGIGLTGITKARRTSIVNRRKYHHLSS